MLDPDPNAVYDGGDDFYRNADPAMLARGRAVMDAIRNRTAKASKSE